jgi:hypothetical protein
MHAILKHESPDLMLMDGTLPPALVRTVRHCLEKSPGERFQSAQHIAFHLIGEPHSVPCQYMLSTL